MVQLPPGAIGLDERLNRLEHNDQQILLKLEGLARGTEVETLRGKVETIEKSYVSKGTLTSVVVFAIVQFLVIIGLGLGLVYELLRQH